MKTVLYPAFDDLIIADQPEPTIAPNEVLIQVAACGVCGSELDSFRARSPRRPPPLIMGHEYCGTIASVGSAVSGWREGQKVVGNSVVPCNNCVRCNRGDTHLCAKRQVFGMHRHGAFAQYVNVPANCLLHWPEALGAEAACLAEPLGNGVHVSNLVRHYAADTVLVVGAGPIGLMCQQALQAIRGSKVIVADLSTGRIGVAERLGALRIVDSGKENPVKVAMDLTDGEGVDVAVDAVGATVTKQQTIDAIRPGGVAVWIGLHGDEMTLSTYGITLPEKVVMGTYAATIDELQTSLDLMANNDVNVDWISRYTLDEGVTAFRTMLKPGETDFKAVICP
jgi:L-iditol 2-dehydrogenase